MNSNHVRQNAANENSTQEGIAVRVGQVWRDLDKRMTGRLVAVVRLGRGFAYVRPWHPSYPVYGRITRLAVARMHKHVTGWALASEAGSVGRGTNSDDASSNPKTDP